MLKNFPGILRNGLHHCSRANGALGISLTDLGRQCGLSDCNNSAKDGNHRIAKIPNGIKYQLWCDANPIHDELKGVKLPDLRPEPPSEGPEPELTPSEKYVIMDPAQIRQRYLFTSCSIEPTDSPHAADTRLRYFFFEFNLV